MNFILKTRESGDPERGGPIKYGKYVDQNDKDVFPGTELYINENFMVSSDHMIVVGWQSSTILLLNLKTVAKHTIKNQYGFVFEYRFQERSHLLDVQFSIPAEMKNDNLGVRFPWYPKSRYEFSLVLNPDDPTSFPFLELSSSNIKILAEDEVHRDAIERIFQIEEMNDQNLWQTLAPEKTGIVFQWVENTTCPKFNGGVSVYGPGFEKPIMLRNSDFNTFKNLVAR